MRKILGFLFRGKRAILTAPLLLAILAAPYFTGRYFWFHARSRGSRTGIVRKVSIKGPPYCKYVSAELSMTGSAAQQVGVGEVWEFSLDDDNLQNPLFKQIEQAERDARRITVHYRQDEANKDKPWLLCDRPEYYAERIE